MMPSTTGSVNDKRQLAVLVQHLMLFSTCCVQLKFLRTVSAGAGVLQGHCCPSPLPASICLQVELQGVSLVVLSAFRDADKARQLADLVQRHGGIMGAAVCCAENGGSPHDEWTTCDRDRDQLLDRYIPLSDV